MGVLHSHEWTNLVFIVIKIFSTKKKEKRKKKKKKGKNTKYIQIKTQIIVKDYTYSDL